MKKFNLIKKLLAMMLILVASINTAWATTYVKGGFNSWGTGNAFSNGVTTVSIASTGTYEFKIDDGGTWYGNNGTISSSEGSWVFLTSDGNCKLNVSTTGTYTFGWDATNKIVTVIFPGDNSKKTLTKNKYIYFDARSESNWISANFDAKFWFKHYGTGADIGGVKCTKTNALENWVYYVQVPNNDNVGRVQMNRLNPSNESDIWNDSHVIYAFSRSDANQNCMVAPSSGWWGIDLSWGTYCPIKETSVISDNSTVTYGGNGGSSTPYKVEKGGTINVSASSTDYISDGNMTTKYAFYVGNSKNQDGTETTYSYTASATAGTTHQLKVNSYNYYNSTSSTDKYSSILYYTTITCYTVTYNANGATDGDVPSVSGTKYESGTDVTLATNTGSLAKNGYSFNGWNTRSDGGGTHYDAGATLSSIGANTPLYAEWSADPGVSLSASKTSGINVGETITLTATGSNASNITKYDFYEGSTKIYTATTSTGTASYSYTPSASGNKTMKVIMTYNSGSNTVTSNNVALTLNVPSVSSLTEANTTTQMWIGVDATAALTFTAASSNVSSGASVTWSASDASSGTFNVTSSSYSGATITYTPASTGAKTITVTMSIGGNNYTRTYNLTVYERWNIYVQNNCSWSAVALYQYGKGTNASWPGVTGASTYCEPYTAKWYKVTLDSYYPYFILGNNVSGSGQEQLPGGNSVATNKGTYAANTYWDFNYTGTTDGVKYYALRSISPSAPTVSITSYEVISCTQIKLTGTISNYGSDGSSAASHMKEVGFYCGETKHSTTHTDGSTFTKVITGLSAGTEYSFKAYAINVKGEGKSSAQAVTTRAGGTYTIKVRTAVGATAPKIYAWTDADANDGVKEENATYATGAAMTAAITGTVYKWWSYDLNKTYNNFLIYQGTDGTKTNDITAPQAATCYWYNSSNAIASRYGTMDCPHANPQLYIETTAGNGTYEHYEMTNTSGTLSKSLTLTAKSTYKFKIFYNGEYFGKGSAKATRGSNVVEDLSAAVDDYVQIETDAAGSYTFEFTTGGKDLTVTYPDAHKITYGIGAINGSNSAIGATSTPSFTSGDYVLDATAVTFTKGTTKNGYHWEGWYSNNDGTGTCHSSTDANWTSAASTRSADIKVYACYSYNNYTITYHLDGGSNHGDNPSGFTVVTPTITLQNPSKTGYNFEGWYTDEGFEYKGNTITVGTYTNQEFWAKWTPKDYTITLNCNGATSTTGVPASVTATYDAVAAPPDGGQFADLVGHHPSRTGYTFGGWYTNNDGTGTCIITSSDFYDWGTSYVDETGHWIHDGNIEVFAKWTANNYTVTLSCSGETGYGSSPSGVKESVSATYGSAMPTMGTAPTPAPGWKFMGYFTGHNGSGTKYYNADGSSATNWNIASETTLYAHFQKTTISSLTHPAAVATGETVYVVVNPVLNQTGAQNYMAICWSLLYDNDNPVESGWSVESYTEGGTKQNQVRFTLTSMASGYYQIKAVLKASASSSFSPCSAGSELSTIKSDLRIAGNSKVTIQYEDASGNTIHENGSVEVARGETVEVTAPELIGYEFSTWALGDVLHTDGALTANPITISADYDGYLTATYTKKKMVYFNNTVGWDTVFVYFYNGADGQQYWDNSVGAGACKNQGWGENSYKKPFWQMNYSGMKRVAPGSNIWYCDYLSIPGLSEGDISANIAFAKEDQACETCTTDATKFFYNTEAIFRGDFNPTNLPMYIPLTAPTTMRNSSTTKYYDQGYWMNYPDNSGYTLKIYDNTTSGALKKEIAFSFPADKKMPMSITTDLEAGKTYGFKIYRADDNKYGNNGTMTNGHSGDGSQGVWEFKTEKNRAGLTTTSAGDYTFTLSYGLDIQATPEYNYLVAVHYPEATGDFRVQYKDNDHTNWRTSVVIPANTESDTISYFVRKDQTPYIRVQKCTATYDEKTGTSVAWNNESSGANIISSLPSAITEDGVYNFIFTKSDGALELEKVEPYEGNFYIRVDGAGSSNWDNFRAADHLMPYSDYSFNQTTDPYSHYFTKYYLTVPEKGDPTPKNIKFVVANDYSTSISDTIVRDGIADAYVDANGWLSGRNANIRFMYNYKTNVATRRYLDDAQGDNSTNFLNLLAQTKDGIYLVAEDGDAQTNIQFADKGDWIYEKTVYAVPGARYKLRAQFGKAPGTVITQYFKGGVGETAADSATLIGGSGSRLPIRLIYDFKTNRIVTAYLPLSGTIDGNLEINADIMFMREHQGDIQQITFAPDKSISKIENIYCGLRFNKWTLNNKSKEAGHATLSPLLSRYERDIFYVSFPYDVRLSDVIGFGTYGQHWIVEYYDGAARAKNGFWIDSDSYWKFVTPSMKDTFTLKAGTGYIVALDLDELYYIDGSHHADIWNNTETNDVELLFPGKVSSISNVDVTYNMPEHTCTINRGTTAGNRTKKDSHWNVLGVPTFKNITGAASADGGGSGEIRFANVALLDTLVNDLKFIYDGNLADNSLTPKAVKDFEFKAMHAYVVQYCGDVTFTTSATPAPAIIARRTYAEAPQEVDFRLELTKDGVMEDQTFISLSNDENVSADFEFGEDLSKEFNTNRANIYTFIGTEWVAGNTLPMSEQTTVVPVGVKTAADGDYTFAMPEGTSGVGVTLVDTETGIRTSLSALEYTVNLEAGTYDNRFYLEISPIVQNPTDIENVQGDNVQGTKVRKVMVDGILYIVKDGKMFDAQGRQVR